MRGFLLLVAIILAAIGVGVGVEAATLPVLYGPPGARFTAAFPAPPTVTSGEVSAHDMATFVYAAGGYAGGGPSDQLTVTVSVAGSGWIAAPPVTPAYRSVTTIVLRKSGPRGASRPLLLRPTRLDGQQVHLGVLCRARTSCIGALFGLTRSVDGHVVEWTATSFARAAASAMGLVTSLRPVSGVLPTSSR